jgi:uncharacterized protein YggE
MSKHSLWVVVLPMLLLASAQASEGHDKKDRTLTVQGQGKAFAVPDIAILSVEVSQDGVELDPVLTLVRKEMAKIQDVVKNQGIADKDVQTQFFQVRPKYEQDRRNNPRRVGYVVSNRISVKVRDLKKVGKVLTAVLNAGATNVDGPNFELDNRQSAEREALAAATKDAKGKAEAVAEAAGVGLGEILSINPQNINWPVSPRPFFGRAMAMSAAVDAQEPIAAGEQTLNAEVSVTYAIR